jgi:hypothetical protein
VMCISEVGVLHCHRLAVEMHSCFQIGSTAREILRYEIFL